MERAVSEILSWEGEGVPSQRVEGQTLVIGVVLLGWGCQGAAAVTCSGRGWVVEEPIIDHVSLSLA